jgi:uncharacterized integral membrane protein
VLKRLLVLPVVFIVAALLITVAVSNRHPVRIVLDPISEVPVLTFELPFFVYLLGALIIGVVLGGTRTWLGQSYWRRSARMRAQEAMRWQAEADRLQREREDLLGGNSAAGGLGKALVALRR